MKSTMFKENIIKNNVPKVRYQDKQIQCRNDKIQVSSKGKYKDKLNLGLGLTLSTPGFH